MSGLKKERVLNAVKIILVQHKNLIDKPNSLAINDYEVEQVSKKLLRIVTSYVDYIKRTVWHIDEL
jgi:UDP-N-acetylglucosamine 2-epimerase